MNVKLKPYEKVKIANSNDIFGIMRKVLKHESKIDRDKEHFWVIGLNHKTKILFLELVYLGGTTAVDVEPMIVYRVAVLKGACSVIFAHNHPSGELRPSEPDKELTDRLIQVGEILGIKAVEHIVLTLDSYYSFRDTGLMEELEVSETYVPNFELIERIKREQAELLKQQFQTEKENAVKESLEKGEKKGKKEGIEIGEKEKAITIAKNMLAKGVKKSDIAHFTGLSTYQINKLAKEIKQT